MPTLPDPNDVDLLFEAINMILERRNEDGSFGTMFKNRSPRNKVRVPELPQSLLLFANLHSLATNICFFVRAHVQVNMQLHVTSVCLRGMSLISRYPVIHSAYFNPETGDDVKHIYPHMTKQWYTQDDVEKAREMLVEEVSDHVLRRIAWVTVSRSQRGAAWHSEPFVGVRTLTFI